MLNSFLKFFNPQQLSNQDLIESVSLVVPEIIELPSAEQIMYWEFIGSKLTTQQHDILSLAIGDLFYTEEQKLNYAQGIIGLSFDIAELNESIKELKQIHDPDENIQAAIKALEELQVELQKSQKKSKLN